ncbi:type ISP restriction/modification enzyme [Candidatus Poriferisocius sp.]|uniref:type ISP restriction/modification enzyme n=1 Tax=Candidatus Poriferisocius sp. TaxID=3101276 RepID=UPI003B5B0FC3
MGAYSVATADQDAFAEYVAALDRFDSSENTEDDLKAPTTNLLNALGDGWLDVLSEYATPVGRPDLLIRTSDGRVVGHIELKHMTKPADPRKLRDRHDKDQWEAFQALPNLVYSNGTEATLWRDGVRLTEQPVAIDTDEWAALWDEFLAYTPTVDSDPKALAKTMGRRARLLRQAVGDALAEGNKGLGELFDTWVENLIPDMDEAGFADNFAQTAMAGLLLARGLVADADSMAFSLPVAVSALRGGGHVMVAQVLNHIDDAARTDKTLAIHLHAIVDGAAALDPQMPSDDDWWVDFYEAFIKQYDRKLQQDRGVFYTPAEIVDYQVRATDWALRELLGKTRGFAGGGVETLDPACGTGTYLARLIEYVADKTSAEQGPGAVMEAVSKTAGSLYGFELMVAPYTVARMRLAAKCQAHGVKLDQSRVLLTDTLSPSGFQQTSTVFAQDIAAQQERANLVKDPKTRVTVVIGNPPYDRDQSQADSAGDDTARRFGGMIRHGYEGEPGLIADFASKTPSGKRGQLQSIYELATYFWRWGVWKVCEQEHPGMSSPGGPGIVCYITPSAWLRSDPWAGMRAHLRARFDHIWVVDLGGDQRSARDDGENVFPIQTPVCITIAVRIGAGKPEPAEVQYRRLTGTRAEKLADLDAITLEGDGWVKARTGWGERFLPEGESDWYEAQPSVDQVLRWKTPGVKYNRRWPIAPTGDVLKRRWNRLVTASVEPDGTGLSERSVLLKATGSRDLDSDPPTLDGSPRPSPRTIRKLAADAPTPLLVEYSFRPLCTQWAIADSRLGDRLRPDLWARHSPRQAYLVVPKLTEAPGDGPTAVIYNRIPDNDSHHGHGGGTVFPLWRDKEATDANADEATVSRLSGKYSQQVSSEEVWHYCAGLLGTEAYPERWGDPMGDTLKPHIPFPDSHEDFEALVAIGRRLVEIAKGINLDKSGVQCTVAVNPSKLPDFTDRCYHPDDNALRFGGGEFTGVTHDIWNHQVSGYRTLPRWIKARSSTPGGRKSSDLDDIQPTTWDFTRDLIEVCDKITSLNHTATQAHPILTRMTGPE